MPSQMIIDIHHHVFPPEVPVHPWNIETDQQAMERCSVTQVLLSCPLQTDSRHAHHWNLFLAQQVSACPSRYAMLGSLGYDDIPAAMEEISFLLDELKVPGLALNTHNGAVYLGNDSLNPIWEKLDRRGALIFLHPCHQRAPGNEKLVFTGNDSVYEYTFDTTRAVMDFVFQDKVTRWPHIRWVLPHAGGAIPFLAHRMSLSGRWGCIPQSQQEILSVLHSFFYDITLNGCDANYALLKKFVGADHLVFGSDYPSCDENILTESLAALKSTAVFTEEEKQNILHGNLERLLNKTSAVQDH